MYVDDEPDPRDPVTPEYERHTWGGVWCLALVCLVLLAACLLSGCCAPGTVRASEVLPLAERVVERHQRYVAADPALLPEDRATYLRSGEILKRALSPSAGSE